MANVVSGVNEKILSFFTGLQFLRIIGWFVFALIVIVAVVYGSYWYMNRRNFNKKITAFDIVGINFIPALRDSAKVTKIGKGGFEILYLKKQKTWKLAYGGKVGKDTYYFFIMPDGYWYNGMLSANIFKIDELGGLIPVTSTNTSMRAQYSSLEKQIDRLHEPEKSFMDKYGVWIFSIGFLLIAGVFIWLNYKQFVIATGNLNLAIEKTGQLLDKVSSMIGNARGMEGQGGLVPA